MYARASPGKLEYEGGLGREFPIGGLDFTKFKSRGVYQNIYEVEGLPSYLGKTYSLVFSVKDVEWANQSSSDM